MALMINKSITDLTSQFQEYKKAFDTFGIEAEFVEAGNLGRPESMCKNKDGRAIFSWKKEEYYISSFCPNCGNECTLYWDVLLPARGCNRGFFTHFSYKIADPLHELMKEALECFSAATLDAYDRAKETCTCPLCGAKLSKDSGYYMETTEMVSAKKSLLNMQSIRESREMDAFNKKLSELVEDYDVPSTSLVPAYKTEGIKNNQAKLKDYVLNLIKLETNIYSIIKYLPDLYKRQLDVNRKVVSYTVKRMYEQNVGLADAKAKVEKCCKRLEVYQAGDFDIKAPVEPVKPTFEVATFFNKKRVLVENGRLQAEYEAQLKAYQESLISYGVKRAELLKEAEYELEAAKVAYENARAEAEISASKHEEQNAFVELKTIIDQEVLDVENMLRKLYECRNELYGYNVIFGKYRNAVALATFYEYLMSGRCSGLEGHEGAYNIYEAELRANTIIGQMSKVIEKLDAVKETQYLIYTELQDINKHLARMNKTLESALESIENMEKGVAHIAKNSDVIAYNTAVTAHFAKMNAELTNALGFMVALK